MIRLSFTLILLLSVMLAFTQSNKFQTGQITLQNGDQKSGLIAGSFSKEDPKGVYFKATSSSNEEFIVFDQIQEVLLSDSIRFITHCAESNSIKRCSWLRTLFQGNVSLHQDLANESLYFLEEGGVFILLRKQNFDGILKVLKQKCPDFTPERKSSFNTHTLIQLISTYSRCKNPTDQLRYYYEPIPDPIRIYIGPSLGLNLNGAHFSKFTYFGRGKYVGDPIANIGPGLAVQFHFNSRLVANTGFSYFQHRFKSDSVNVWPVISPNYSKVSMNLSFLDVPFTLQYHFSKKRVSPFLQLGANLGIALKKEVTEKQFIATPQELSQQPRTTFPSFSLGYGGGLGVRIRLKEKMHLQFLCQYTRFETPLAARSTLFGDGAVDPVTIYLTRVQLGGMLTFRL
jgi:outer membrane protein W